MIFLIDVNDVREGPGKVYTSGRRHGWVGKRVSVSILDKPIGSIGSGYQPAHVAPLEFEKHPLAELRRALVKVWN